MQPGFCARILEKEDKQEAGGKYYVAKKNSGKMVTVSWTGQRCNRILCRTDRLSVEKLHNKVYLACGVDGRLCFSIHLGRRAGVVDTAAFRQGGHGARRYQEPYEKASAGGGSVV